MLDMAILGLLEERDLHGYEIRRQLRDNLGILANVSFGSIYPALTRLEKAGAVVATEGSAVPGDAGAAAARRPPHRLAQRRAGRAAGPPPLAVPLPPRQEGLPDHREGPAALRPAPGRRRARSTTPAASGCGWPSPGISPPRPGWPSSSAAGPSWSSAWPRPRGRTVELDVYARSVVQHTADSVAQDISWLDRLIAGERAVPQVSEHAAPHSVPTELTYEGDIR